MCMVVNGKPKFRRSLFPHTYYKVLTTSIDGLFFSPYQASFVEIGKDYKISEDTEPDVRPWLHDWWEVYGGCYHLFRKKEDADRIAKHLTEWYGVKHVVVKAVVPAGTRCVKGTFGSTKSVAVRRVRYKKID